MHFKDKVVWITGASSGIGKELAIQMSSLGAILILTSSNELLLCAIKAELSSSKVHFLPYNLLELDGLPDLVERAWALEGTIDCVIQSAGISQRAEAADTSLEVYKKLMDLNYFAPVAITQALLPHFKKHDKGNIGVYPSWIYDRNSDIGFIQFALQGF